MFSEYTNLLSSSIYLVNVKYNISFNKESKYINVYKTNKLPPSFTRVRVGAQSGHTDDSTAVKLNIGYSVSYIIFKLVLFSVSNAI